MNLRSLASASALAALLSPTSLAAGLQVLASLETAGVGAVKDTVSGSVIDNWTVADGLPPELIPGDLPCVTS